MNQTRSFLLIAWLLVAGFLYMEWNKAPVATAASQPTTSTTTVANALPNALPNASAQPAALPGSPTAANAPVITDAAAQPFTIENDVLRLTIDLNGGRLTDSQLLQYTVEKKPGSPDVRLLSTDRERYFTADAGLIQTDAQQRQHTLDERFTTSVSASAATLADGAASVSVPLTWVDPATGLTVLRTLTLDRGSYVLRLEDAVSNGGSAAQVVYPYVSLDRVALPPPPKHSFMTNPETFSFIGAAWWSPESKYEKAKLAKFDSDKPPTTDITGGWIAMLQHHFVTAWVPAEKEPQRFQTSTNTRNGTQLFEIKSIGQPLNIAPGANAKHTARLWVGPKLQQPLEALAPSLDRTVDYGVFYVISRPLFVLLSWLHSLLGNWGWAIIAIVVLLKAALYPLSAKQYQSMAKMRAVMPRIEALKERYGDDRQGFAVAQMDLYKKEGVNPLGGCLPMLIPIPIFLGLYWVLLETVELRHAPWMGWIQNLTDADPYFVLPALNLLVMFLTQKLTPTPGMDPMQKKMMQFMPLVFGVMMAFFPSGLVLYWVTNGSLGLLQQWWMTKRHGPKAPPPAKKAVVAK